MPEIPDFIGGRTRTRTWDPLIKSQLLYQLSYAPGMPPAKDPAGARSCSKAGSHCPAKARMDVPQLAGWCLEILSSARPPQSDLGPGFPLEFTLAKGGSGNER